MLKSFMQKVRHPFKASQFECFACRQLWWCAVKVIPWFTYSWWHGDYTAHIYVKSISI